MAMIVDGVPYPDPPRQGMAFPDPWIESTEGQFEVVAISDYRLDTVYISPETSWIRAGRRVIAKNGPTGGTYYIRWMQAWHAVNADKFSVLHST